MEAANNMKRTFAVWEITLLMSIFISIFANISFWQKMIHLISIRQEPLLLLSFFIILIALINLLLTLLSFKPVFKISLALFLVISATAAYFIDNYAVMIDDDMVRNVLVTDFSEAEELFSLRLLITVFLLSILPTLWVIRLKIVYQPFFKGVLQKTLIVFICGGVIATTMYTNFQDISFFSRNNRELRHLINPTNTILSLKSVISKNIRANGRVVKAIENDAHKLPSSSTENKPSLVIMVLGETARAMNFSLNGYQRETNPLLAKQKIINFNNVSSCGTATAVSVPCLLSKFSRTEFSYRKGKEFQNVLDVATHAGYDVLWRDNNTGCQGSCERIHYESLAHKTNADYCEKGNCTDEILLHNLQQIIDQKKNNSDQDQLIILHQKGNHGPTYHRRYPARFEIFKPACKTNQLRSCSREEITNAYDNALLYSDYFLNKTIRFLQQNAVSYNTAMIYISDHGESLGENNIYLHGLPYMIAPTQQKKVPFILWLSNNYQQHYSINSTCLSHQSSNKLSHDNFFSSMLGLLAIETQVRNGKLDIFDTCKQAAVVSKEVGTLKH
jgi:lipid A ethanolaminephosphotransferase